MLELLIAQMNSKNCKDQIFLLMHEVQTAELCYSLLADKSSDFALQSVVLKVTESACQITKRISITNPFR